MQMLQILSFQRLRHQTPAIPWFHPVADIADINTSHKIVGKQETWGPKHRATGQGERLANYG
jgi:hypothetical protein